LAIAVPAANVRNVLGVDNGELRPSWKTVLDATNPTTLTVSTAAAPGTSLVFSHRDHAHAITSSSAPGAAASLLASDAAGALTLVDLTLSSLTASTVIYSDAAKKVVSLANGGGYLNNNGTGTLSWISSTYAPDLLDTLLLSSLYGGGCRLWAWDAVSPFLFTAMGSRGLITGTLTYSDYHITTAGGTYEEFDGAADGLYDSDNVYQISGAATMLVWAWCKADTLITTNKTIMAKFNPNGDQRSWILFYNVTSGKFSFLCNALGTAAANITVESSYAESAATWYFVAGVFSPSALMRIYVGATADANLTIDSNTTSIPASTYDSSAKFTIGYYENNVTGECFWDGPIGVLSGWAGIPVGADIDTCVNLVFDRTKQFYA